MYYLPIIGFLFCLTRQDDLPIDKFSIIVLGPWQGFSTGLPIMLLIIYIVEGHV